MSDTPAKKRKRMQNQKASSWSIMITYSSSQNGESAQLKLSHIRPKSADPHAQHDQQANSIKKGTRHVGGGSHSSGSWAAEDSPNAECCRSGSEFGLFKTRTMRGEQRSKSKTCLDHLDLPKKGNKCKTRKHHHDYVLKFTKRRIGTTKALTHSSQVSWPICTTWSTSKFDKKKGPGTLAAAATRQVPGEGQAAHTEPCRECGKILPKCGVWRRRISFRPVKAACRTIGRRLPKCGVLPKRIWVRPVQNAHNARGAKIQIKNLPGSSRPAKKRQQMQNQKASSWLCTQVHKTANRHN